MILLNWQQRTADRWDPPKSLHIQPPSSGRGQGRTFLAVYLAINHHQYTPLRFSSIFVLTRNSRQYMHNMVELINSNLPPDQRYTTFHHFRETYAFHDRFNLSIKNRSLFELRGFAAQSTLLIYDNCRPTQEQQASIISRQMPVIYT